MEMHNTNFDDASAFHSMAPDPEDAARTEMIDYLVQHLRRVGPSQDQVAFDLDMILATLEKDALGRGAKRLNGDEYRQLSSALSVATVRAYFHPPVGLNQLQVFCGMRVIDEILRFWALPDENRHHATRPCRQLRALARVFRNQMHNANLLNQVRFELAGKSGADRRVVLPQTFSDPTDTMILFVASMTAPDIVDAAEHLLDELCPRLQGEHRLSSLHTNNSGLVYPHPPTAPCRFALMEHAP